MDATANIYKHKVCEHQCDRIITHSEGNIVIVNENIHDLISEDPRGDMVDNCWLDNLQEDRDPTRVSRTLPQGCRSSSMCPVYKYLISNGWMGWIQNVVIVDRYHMGAVPWCRRVYSMMLRRLEHFRRLRMATEHASRFGACAVDPDSGRARYHCAAAPTVAQAHSEVQPFTCDDGEEEKEQISIEVPFV